MENLEQENKNMSLHLISEYGASDSEPEPEEESPAMDSAGTSNVRQESSGLSAMVLKNNIINACVHGPLSHKDGETSNLKLIDSEDGTMVEFAVTQYREQEPSSSSDSEVESVKDVDSEDDDMAGSRAGTYKPSCIEGEDGLDKLPPIEDLKITVPSDECEVVGTVVSVIGRLVVVEGVPGKPCVDLDSVLFLDKGDTTLGTVHDVFGNVNEPRYTVRFNSREHAKDRGVQVGMNIYYAPNTKHTNLVFLPDLLKMRGTDASWKEDSEPPPGQDLDFSDDEEERNYKKLMKHQRIVQRPKPNKPAPSGPRQQPTEPRQQPEWQRENPHAFRQQNPFGGNPRRNLYRPRMFLNQQNPPQPNYFNQPVRQGFDPFNVRNQFGPVPNMSPRPPFGYQFEQSQNGANWGPAGPWSN